MLYIEFPMLGHGVMNDSAQTKDLLQNQYKKTGGGWAKNVFETKDSKEFLWKGRASFLSFFSFSEHMTA